MRGGDSPHYILTATVQSPQVHSLSVAEKEGDNPSRFAVGTGPIGSWDQYYVLEASSPEKKQQWVRNIKDILKGQFELLRGQWEGFQLRVQYIA